MDNYHEYEEVLYTWKGSRRTDKFYKHGKVL